MTFTDLMCPMRRQCGGRGLMALSDGGVPEHGGGLSGGGGGGWGRVGRRLLPPPAGQYGHTVLFAQIPLRPLARLDLPAQDPLLLDHLHHGGVSAQPRHLEHNGDISMCTAGARQSLTASVCVSHDSHQDTTACFTRDTDINRGRPGSRSRSWDGPKRIRARSQDDKQRSWEGWLLESKCTIRSRCQVIALNTGSRLKTEEASLW